MSKVSSKKLAKLAARIVKFDPTIAAADHGEIVAFFNGGETKLLVNVVDLVALAASVLSQSDSQPEEKPKKTRPRK